MNWIVSKKACETDAELKSRWEYIKKTTGVIPSAWSVERCSPYDSYRRLPEYYICRTKKGEYGIIITAHIYEVLPILNTVMQRKRAIVVINSCMINAEARANLYKFILSKHPHSELFFAKQENRNSSNPALVNYIDNVGTFGFGTTNSERELFMNRSQVLIMAIRGAFDRITE